MAAFDKGNEPLDDLALKEHIEKALITPPPSGRSFDLTYKFVRRVFNPVVVGDEKIPDQPCLFVGNHSLFAFDGAVLAPVMLRDFGRFLRGLGDKFLFANPSVARVIMHNGGVMGHPEVCGALMQNGSDLVVFPGGAHEAVKPVSDRYSLQWKERYGFVKLAAMHGYTIMPFGMVGPDEFYGHFMEGEEIPGSPLGRVLSQFGVLTEDTRTDMMPPIPLGLMGSLLPKPQRCYIGFGEPVDLSQFEGKKMSKGNLRIVRNQVADEIEEQLSELLLLREQHKGGDGLLRRLLTF